MACSGSTFKTACWTCRERKVKCEKVLPCDNCVSAGVSCSFPPQFRTVRRPKTKQQPPIQRESDLLEKIRHLESCLKKQRRQQQQQQQHPHFDLNLNSASPSMSFTNGEPLAEMSDEIMGFATTANTDCNSGSGRMAHMKPNHSGPDDAVNATANARFGTFMHNTITSGTSPSESISTSQQDIQGPQSVMEEDDHDGLFSVGKSYAEFPFKPAQCKGKAPPLLPIQHRRICWRRYVANVDPIVKILHKPTAETLVTTETPHCLDFSHAVVALIHAICLIAVVSMSQADVLAQLDMEKEELLKVCASYTEQALMAADFLAAKDLRTLQALLLFLYYLKHMDDTRFDSMCAVAISLARKLGLNRDGTTMGLSRLELESRRRLWWQLLNLADQPDDIGMDRFAPSIGADTALPSNMNDNELEFQYDGDKECSSRFTELSFCLIQYEITRTFGDIKCAHAQSPDRNEAAINEAEKRLKLSQQMIKSRYLCNGVDEHPLGRFAADVASMALAKRRLLVHMGQGSPPPPRTYDQLFLLAVRVLELWRGIQNSKHLQQWRWLSSSYAQWSVATFVVKSLAIRPLSFETRRAWHVVDGLLDQYPIMTRNSARFSALQHLLVDAEKSRDAANLWQLRLSWGADHVLGDPFASSGLDDFTTVGQVFERITDSEQPESSDQVNI
ncbi:hypothetical protein PFICI_05092 [Pestalotiopsis fici W106-1]|uniref:Zn(2)-C6 fungal-type domain-containing protein n=1 Tax=Pestalotiopsis fici (strain W106-1 / CGMCC3.15140) TaxID=1229662 RepID=W3XDH0_PESFW|nr:uncharacterized protein PFICI_05092 [Pestalotiopsis fici W106-1]ETS83216.1 hypothetical protein PFICI_05092 [Pestalotiopsis fici W106-1]